MKLIIPRAMEACLRLTIAKKNDLGTLLTVPVTAGQESRISVTFSNFVWIETSSNPPLSLLAFYSVRSLSRTRKFWYHEKIIIPSF